LVEAARLRTPARILLGRAGPAYRTATQLDLRQDHAAAVDAVRTELELDPDFVQRWQLLEVRTRARDKAEYLARPDLGRRLEEAAASMLAQQGTTGTELQVVLGDGLSAAAVVVQVPVLLPLLAEGARQRGWTFGRPLVVRHCRVGILNDIGERLDPVVAVLLIGERPGMATAESLSAYLAYRPRPGDTDARRNLISNIHARGVPPAAAAARILALADRLRHVQASGVAVKEDMRPELPP
jgi:ethanolamine ammonia-lyase small subunit